MTSGSLHGMSVPNALNPTVPHSRRHPEVRALARLEGWVTGPLNSRIHMHEIAQQRIDFVVPAFAREHAVMADAGLHVMHLAIGAHAGAEILRRQRLPDRADVVLFALDRHQSHPL